MIWVYAQDCGLVEAAALVLVLASEGALTLAGANDLRLKSAMGKDACHWVAGFELRLCHDFFLLPEISHFIKQLEFFCKDSYQAT